MISNDSKDRLRLLHLIDDEKFTDITISHSLAYSSLKGYNMRHVFLLNNVEKKYCKLKLPNIILKGDFNEYKEYIENFNADAVLVHCLTLNKMQALRSMKSKNCTIVWLVWGVDFYSSVFYKEDLFLPETKRVLGKLETLTDVIKRLFRNSYHFYKYGATSQSAIINFSQHVDIIVPVIADEFSLIKNATKSNAVFSTFSYGSMKDMKKNFEGTINIMLGENIFVGNSNAFECNHIDAFQSIKKAQLSFNKLVVPLNYAGNTTYKLHVLKKGEQMFGNLFYPLIDFIPYKDYCNQLLGCKVAIYNHLRQQAVGNIIISLYLGQKVFLSKKNIVYTFLKNNAFYVYCMESELTKEEVNIPLNRQQILKNRALLNDHYGDEAIEKKLTHFFETIIEISLHKKAMCKIRS